MMTSRYTIASAPKENTPITAKRRAVLRRRLIARSGKSRRAIEFRLIALERKLRECAGS